MRLLKGKYLWLGIDGATTKVEGGHWPMVVVIGCVEALKVALVRGAGGGGGNRVSGRAQARRISYPL